MSTEGVLGAARIMQRNRQTHRKLSLLLESGSANLVADLIDVMYQRIAADEEAACSGAAARCVSHRRAGEYTGD
jgi:hypothetical protein